MLSLAGRIVPLLTTQLTAHVLAHLTAQLDAQLAAPFCGVTAESPGRQHPTQEQRAKAGSEDTAVLMQHQQADWLAQASSSTTSLAALQSWHSLNVLAISCNSTLPWSLRSHKPDLPAATNPATAHLRPADQFCSVQSRCQPARLRITHQCHSKAPRLFVMTDLARHPGSSYRPL